MLTHLKTLSSIKRCRTEAYHVVLVSTGLHSEY